MPNLYRYPDFRFRFFRVTFAEDGPPAFTFAVPGLRIVARLKHPRHDIFVIKHRRRAGRVRGVVASA
jgi:hypothetical protein